MRPLESADLLQTPLHALHLELGAKMVPFAGYDMPVQFPAGILKEHLHTRAAAGLFDVSHMGQAWLHLEGKGTHDDIAALLETLCPGEIKALKPGQIRYTLLLNDEGGIRDDFMVSRPLSAEKAGTLFLVSHDRRFVDNVVTSTLAFEGDALNPGLWRETPGGYEDWRSQRDRARSDAKAPEAA